MLRIEQVKTQAGLFCSPVTVKHSCRYACVGDLEVLFDGHKDVII